MSGARKSEYFGRVWLWPLLLAIAGLMGLLSALVGDGIWDALSWITLGAPILVVLAAASRERPG